MTDYSENIAKAALDIGAIKLRPGDPFQWASGFMMPIYNDNRMLLFFPEYRGLCKEGFAEMIKDEDFEVIAGTSTAGIAPGAILAEKLGKPFIYIRDKPKGHGLKNQIEGIDADKDLEGKKVIVVEDLISTGGSSARAVQAVRDANGKCDLCVSIFTYGLLKAVNAFDDLPEKCRVMSLLDYDTMLKVAKDTGYLNDDQVKLLEEWREDPFRWGEKHGFPKVEG